MRPALNPAHDISVTALDRDDAPQRTPEQKLFFWLIIRALRDWSNADAAGMDDHCSAKASQRDAEELLFRDAERLRVFCEAALVDYAKLRAAIGRGPDRMAEVFLHEDHSHSGQIARGNSEES